MQQRRSLKNEKKEKKIPCNVKFFSFQYEGSLNEVLVFVSNVKTQV